MNMKHTQSTNSYSSRRWLLYGLVLFVAVVAAGVSWNWNRLVQLPGPDIVIHTESEAFSRAREFLATAQIGTSNYDISHASYIAKDRLKGHMVWRIVWLAKPDAETTNKLSVLASETGWLYTNERISSNQWVAIEGAKTNQSSFIITRNPYTVVSRSQLETPTNNTLGDKN